MSRKSSGRLQAREDATAPRFGKSPRSGRQILHTRLRGTSDSTSSACGQLPTPRNRKEQVFFARNKCVILAQGQNRETRILQGHSFSSLHRNQEKQQERRILKSTSIDARCSKTRSMRVAQSSRTIDLSRPHTAETRLWEVSHPMRWTARGEQQKLQKGQYLDISADIPEGEEDPWTNASTRTAANTETTPHRSTPRNQSKQQQHVCKFQHGGTSGK